MKPWIVNGPWQDEPDNVYLWVDDDRYCLGFDFISGHERDEMLWLQPSFGPNEVFWLPRSWTVA